MIMQSKTLSVGTAFFSLLIVCAPALAQAEETLGKPREDLRVKYAKVRLQLAESELGERLQMNKKLPGTVERVEVDHFRARVKIAKEQLKLAQTLSAGTATPTQLTAAKAIFERAQRDYRAVLKANKMSPGTFSQHTVERYKLKVELARIRVEMWKDPAYLPSILDEMRWQIDRLTEQVIELQHKVEEALDDQK